MGQVIGSGSPVASGSAGYIIYDVPSPGAIGSLVINAFTTLQVPAYWRAVDFKAANLASFPRTVRKDRTPGTPGALIAHPLDRLLERRPNGYQSCTMLWRTWFFHHAHYANGFIEIERDSLFAPRALHNRMPEIVAPFRYLGDDGEISQWYAVGGMTPHLVPFADMMHLTGLSYDGQTGMNPVWMQSETLERGRLLDRYITRFLVKGSVVRGAVQIPVGATKEQIDTVRYALRKFQGADAEEDVLVLSAGATMANATISPQQSQLVELHQLSTTQVAQITGVNPYFLFSDPNGKYNNNTQQAGEDIVRYCFRLLIEQAEDELLKLLSPAEQDAGLSIHIDPAALLRGDAIAESNIVTQQTAGGVITRNEGRARLGYEPSDDPIADQLKVSGDTAAAEPIEQSPGPNSPPAAKK